MAPRLTYDPPHAQLLRLAIEARREGVSFEAFWKRAVRTGMPLIMTTHPNPPDGAVRWPTDQSNRTTWKMAIESSKDGWRRAYCRMPASPQESALTILAPTLDRVVTRLDAAAAAELAPGIGTQSGVASAA